jgi:hypothetical protein
VRFGGRYWDFVRLFEWASGELITALRGVSSRLLATIKPTFGIFSTGQSPQVEAAVAALANAHGVPLELLFPGQPRVMLCLDAQRKLQEGLEADGLGSDDVERLTGKLRRSVLAHEHLHAVLELGLDAEGATPTGPRNRQSWDTATPLNESLAAWVELHAARTEPDIRNLIINYIGSGSYPAWPYPWRGACRGHLRHGRR